MVRHHRVLFAAAAVLAVAGCAPNLPKTIGGFDQMVQQMDAIAIMPSSFGLTEVGAFSAGAVSELNHDIEIEINAALEPLVKESRYKLAPLDLGDSVLAQDSEARTKIFASVQETGRVSGEIRQIKGTTMDVSYGADLDYFADMANADYFLFISGGGWFKTGGAKAKEVATSVVLAAVFGAVPTSSPGSATSMEAALVDANLGKVIWYNAVSVNDRDPRKPSDLFNTTKALMQPLLGKSGLKADKSRDDVLTDKYKGKLATPASGSSTP